MSSSSSSSSSRLGWPYDVFLSFRGEDTRKNFTDHLYTALLQAGIHTFRDDNELRKGEEISSHLLKAIQESKISIVVFSKGYASSTWCLDELSEILDCRQTAGQIVLPVFYDIDPSDIRKQKRSFAEAFDRHEELFKEEMEKVQKWRTALLEAGILCGFDLHSIANGHESKLIQMIVEEVLSKLNPRYMKVATYPVGIDSQVKDIISMLCVGTNEVRIVGIYGMPGIGKTTIAKAVFNQICHKFEGSSCLLNISERLDQHTGLLKLKKQLLRDILKGYIWHCNDDDEGINLIKSRFCRKRVLVILDDVDQLKHLRALAGERDWFGPGSRIVITTRDERLLTRLEVEKKYHAKGLNNEESLQLFSWHAFKRPHPMKEYVELSKVVVDYVDGVPLALEVLGSKLFKRSITHWRSFIEKLQKHLPHQIQRQLITSLDDLDGEVKGMFLDIACFFNGMDKDYVGKILDGRGFYPEMGFDILGERSLLTVNSENELQMNNLLRDMGREIIHQMAPNHPGKRSRLWHPEDIMDVLDKYCSGTEVVEGIVLDAQASKDVFPSTSFAPMTSLQLLKLTGGRVGGHYEHISKALIWLCWHKFSLKTLPHKFRLDSLVVLDMQHSNIRELWKETECLNNLKVIDLSNSRFYAKTPNFSGLPSLERLILENCTSLADIHQSVGELKKLVFLNLKGCYELKKLPESISELKSLETMNLERCYRLEKLPEQLGNMQVLTDLLLDGTYVQQLPSSTGILKKLKKLLVRRVRLPIRTAPPLPPSLEELVIKEERQPFLPPSFSGLSSLTTLDISNRYLSNNDISINLGSLSSLQDLNLAGNDFSELPAGIGHLAKLEKLDLSRCPNLLFISETPSSFKSFGGT
ncbi:PREDICTED: TMV resistance protein N-like [Populus euphratica]|uniref:TMV resistance protein N-like n=1 Tax=Populus euphratica TaxID=75702 RepID=A0AAJ6XBZ5_POPEU|nr:PREDICTED: TMV resistance protein N-like [Populus euphratica]